jgi:Tfp pilus assembly protein FimT
MRVFRRLRKPKYGLSMAEFLMAMAIAAILVVLLVAQYASVQARHRDDERKKDIATLRDEVARYYALRGYYPASLSIINNLPADACRAPGEQGSCQTPDYTYIAFRDGVPLSADADTNCDNKKRFCVNFLITTNHMETIGNPYQVQSH